MKLKYDATDYTLCDTSEVLTQRYPHLSYEEHCDRRLVALHEASHLITAMVLRTGWAGCRVFVRAPRVPTGMHNIRRGVTGLVHCGADGWEDAIVYFAGIASAFITDDPLKVVAGRNDAANGMEESTRQSEYDRAQRNARNNQSSPPPSTYTPSTKDSKKRQKAASRRATLSKSGEDFNKRFSCEVKCKADPSCDVLKACYGG